MGSMKFFLCDHIGVIGVPQPFDAHCRHMATAIKHPVPDWVKLSFVIFDIWELCRLRLSVRVPGCQKLQMTA